MKSEVSSLRSVPSPLPRPFAPHPCHCSLCLSLCPSLCPSLCHSPQFCRYFDVEERTVPCEEGRLVASPDKMRELIDDNTIGVVGGWPGS